MRKIVAKVVLAGMVMSVTGCGGKTITHETEATAVSGAEESGAEEKVKVGFIVGTGGLGDQGFNDIAYEGLKRAEEELGIELEYAEPQSVSDFEPLISQFAQDGSYDLIISLDQQSQSALEKIAELFPEQKFSAVDMNIEADNVKVIRKDFSQLAFLPGYFAGLLTTDTSVDKVNEEACVGIMIGVDNPNMQNGVLGYTAGARLANPDTEVLTGIVGSYGDPAKGKDTAKVIYDKGADIVMNFAGSSGLGLTNQAKESERLVIGGTSNVNATAPDVIAASALEQLSDRVYNDVKAVIDGTWESGIEMGVIANGGVDIAFEGTDVAVPEEIIEKIDHVRTLIKDGKLTLPSSVEEIDGWLEEAAGVLK